MDSNAIVPIVTMMMLGATSLVLVNKKREQIKQNIIRDKGMKNNHSFIFQEENQLEMKVIIKINLRIKNVAKI